MTTEKTTKKDERPHWCMHCLYYVNSAKNRPLMECKKRGGTRLPNDGENCELFKRKQ